MRRDAYVDAVDLREGCQRGVEEGGFAFVSRQTQRHPPAPRQSHRHEDSRGGKPAIGLLRQRHRVARWDAVVLPCHVSK